MNLLKLADTIRDIDVTSPRDLEETEWSDGYRAGMNMMLDAVVELVESLDTNDDIYKEQARRRFAVSMFKRPRPIEINLGEEIV